MGRRRLLNIAVGVVGIDQLSKAVGPPEFSVIPTRKRIG